MAKKKTSKPKKEKLCNTHESTQIYDTRLYFLGFKLSRKINQLWKWESLEDVVDNTVGI